MVAGAHARQAKEFGIEKVHYLHAEFSEARATASAKSQCNKLFLARTPFKSYF